MVAARVVGVVGLLLLAAACSGEHEQHVPEPALARPASRAQAPVPPSRVPELPLTGERDRDGDRLDDEWQRRLHAAAGDEASLQERVRLQVILRRPLEQQQLDQFVAQGGRVDYVYRELSYGFNGSIALASLPALAGLWGDALHLLAAPSVIVPFLDEATRTGRVRGVWVSGFAGSVAGYSGSSDITIAVLDSGVDEQHSDLSGRKRGWQDYTSESSATPSDVGGHGTHVAGIALGSGAAFGANAGTLRYTQSADLSEYPANTFVAAPIHTPAYLGSGAPLLVSAQARFLGGGSARLFAMSAADGTSAYAAFGNASGPSPLALTNESGGSTAQLYDGGMIQSDPPNVTNFAVASSVSNYPGVGDGFNALRGVAPGCQWFGAKVFPSAGQGNSLDIEQALDDVVARKASDNIKVANLSLGVAGSGIDTSIRAKVNGLVDAGIVVVVAAGNDFPQTIGDPGRAAKAITVGATNDLNQLTEYSSVGAAAAPGVSEDSKPDVVAPGGSAYRSQILAADTGSADGEISSFEDLVANDYASMQGTSMAAPFVSGAVALMIDALQKSGTSWTFASSAQPLLLKMLLLASASETNAAREQGAGNNPGLGRAGALRDRSEGYGIINPDAAIEALLQTFVSPLDGSVSNVAPARLEWERRAWGRKLSLVNGATVLLNLSVPGTADHDLYLFAGTPDGKGNPVLRASSTTAGNGTDETINFVSAATETAYVFVKRVAGHGTFVLTGSAESHCGDGKLDQGELCDPAMAEADECCTQTCATLSDGSACDDGNECTKTDGCQAGKCAGGNAVVCTALDQCHVAGTCAPGTGLCTNPNKPSGSDCDDGNLCTQTDECQAGSCQGSDPVVCAALDQCHLAGSCVPATGLCNDPQKNDGAACNDGTLCTQSDSCQAGKCVGAAPVVCVASGVCHDAGVCNPASGQCTDPNSAEGTSCGEQGSCQAGACVEPMPGEGGAGGVGAGGDGAGGNAAGGDSAGGDGNEPVAGGGAGGDGAGGGGAGGVGVGAGGAPVIGDAGAGGVAEPGAAGAGAPAEPGTGGSASGGQPLAGGSAPLTPQASVPNTSSGCGCNIPGGGREPWSGALALAGLVVSFGTWRRVGRRSRWVGLPSR